MTNKLPEPILHVWRDERDRYFAVVDAHAFGNRHEHVVHMDQSRTAEMATVRSAVRAWEEALPDEPVLRAGVLLAEAAAETARCEQRVIAACKAVADNPGDSTLIDLADAQRHEDAAEKRFSALIDACKLVLPEAYRKWINRRFEEG